MLAHRVHKNLVWLDLSSPSQEEVRSLMREYSIHPLVADELLTPSVRQKTERYGDFLYMVFHFPGFGRARQLIEQEVDFVVGKRVFVTARYGEVPALDSFARTFETSALIDQDAGVSHGGHVLYLMIRRFYRALFDDIESVREELRRIEEQVFLGEEQRMVFEISRTSRIILDFERTLAPHKEILSSLEAAGGRLFGQEFSFYSRLLQSEYLKVENSLDEVRDSLQELRETNNSLLSTKQNEIMKVFTIMAFVTFPLTLVSSIFGMNTSYLPIVGTSHDFWIVMSIMGTLAASFFAYFKHKKWL